MAFTSPASNAQLFDGTAGEAITAGNVVYKLASDGKYYKASNAAAASAAIAGVACNSAAAADQPISIATGGDLNWSGLTVGNVLVLSTAGGTTTGNAAGTTYPALVGLAVTTSKLRLAIAQGDGVAA